MTTFNFEQYFGELSKFLSVVEGNQQNLQVLMKNARFQRYISAAIKILYSRYQREAFGEEPTILDQFVIVSDDWFLANYYKNFRINEYNALDAYTMETIIASIDLSVVYFLTDNALPLEYIQTVSNAMVPLTQAHNFEINKFILREEDVTEHLSSRVLSDVEDLSDEDLNVLRTLLNTFETLFECYVDKSVSKMDDILLKNLKNY